MRDMDTTTAIGIAILLILLLIYAPLGVIWALNVLFHLAIPYTLKTWAAAFILSAAVKGLKVSKSN